MDPIRFGRALRVLRRRHGWTQEALATRARLSRSVVGRAERGLAARIAFGDLEAIARTLDGRLGLDFWWRGEALDRLIDERHAGLVDAIARRFGASGWEVEVEVSFSIYGERGSIDVLARHVTGRLAVVEVKATVGEVGSTLIGLDRKARLAPAIAHERGWPCRGVAKLLVIEEGTTSRDRVRRHQSAFRAALPERSRACLGWIRDPIGAPPSGIVFLPSRNDRVAAKRRTFT